MEKIMFTQEAYDKLVKDLENLKNVERPRVLQELVDARAQGDLSENAEYHAAKERLASIDNIEMPKLQDQLARAQVIAFDANSDTIKFGATITAKNLKTKREIVYQLVSPEEADALNGKISFKSPIGAALMGKKRGDTVEVVTPKGKNQFEIIDFK
ncbi:transcription elongation factor GreA [Fibrobacter succinogenes subsp. succinogenes S85]|jgi:transcription elongation factor GreA|uniref:Transcription elongation factor GreA n=3 Tax=Fibrobacter succinogenes TaxID=833 RepID=D9S7C5_FIBSS|nr:MULTISPECIES: transcription elongation factor GreA [Fibrobacter]ADL27116.1 transcription elongation factor GreA [Fibrobacter succinogenes subsp. succinogenes S85]MDY6332692.1 transcription elongation factor GreA [Fibrobacter sp.]OWV19445.1 transcription elongation factor GreA [Fibrobacter sp. UWB3]OWV23788.1 transcription elongation factor GreA [Fibrobacter sp. UWB2]